MAEVMLGKELHPDRVIPIEKLYEILNQYGINYSFPAQHGIENNSFAVVRCKDRKHWHYMEDGFGDCIHPRFHIPGIADHTMEADGFCSCGERRTNDDT